MIELVGGPMDGATYEHHQATFLLRETRGDGMPLWAPMISGWSGPTVEYVADWEPNGAGGAQPRFTGARNHAYRFVGYPRREKVA